MKTSSLNFKKSSYGEVNTCLVVCLGSFVLLMFCIWGLVVMNMSSDLNFLMLEVDCSNVGGFFCTFPVMFDWCTLTFSITVLLISGSVMLFCCFYMSHEVFIKRFIFLVLAFVLFMQVLIIMPSMFVMMMGWDGLGVVSFLLVLYYGNSESLAAGVITAMTNRIGDALFIVLLASYATEVWTWQFFEFDMQLLNGCFVSLLVLASMTKSAQVPFSAWLPAAMAAPTPVSALVHSSTLVTAGVYVLFRFSGAFQGIWFSLLSAISMLTLILAGMSATMEVDFKKIVAFSTLSQLGMMVLALSLGLKYVCFFHLITHAFFKALMFLCVGSVIFMGGGIQDVRFFSGLWYKMPVISSWIIVCCFSLMGVPFMAGFYSKDLIVEGFLYGGSSVLGVLFLFLSVMLTALYSGRLMLMLFSSFSFFSTESFTDSDPFLLGSVSILGAGAIFSGYVLQKMLFSFNTFVWVPGYFKLLTLFFVLAGFICSIILFKVPGGAHFSKSPSKFLYSLYHLVSLMWFLPLLSGGGVSKVGLGSFITVSMSVEKGWVDSYVFKTLLTSFVQGGKSLVRFLQSEKVVGGSVILLGVLSLWVFLNLS
nr:NADH dehydrogenase subunit 5 [Xylophaga oregona]UPX88930.1 NADH dehydrogenase subunit 5 [Xylophaga oregona]